MKFKVGAVGVAAALLVGGLAGPVPADAAGLSKVASVAPAVVDAIDPHAYLINDWYYTKASCMSYGSQLKAQKPADIHDYWCTQNPSTAPVYPGRWSLWVHYNL